MTDVVLMPTYNRPEYLWLALEALAATDGGPEKHLLISHDRHNRDLTQVQRDLELSKQVAEHFKPQFASLSFHVRDPHPYIGNPLNFLELYKEAYLHEQYRYVYLVEDDVLVGKDFFRWHEAVQPTQDFLCTVGWHCVRNPEVPRTDDPTGYIVSTRDFSSIGVCWRREALAPLVKHARVEFYRDMRNYLATAFPGSPIAPGQWTEQAGVVTRLLHETRTRWVAWPGLARCFHIGVSGYHRPNGRRFAGDLSLRVAELRQSLTLRTLCGSDKEWPDDINLPEPQKAWMPEQLHITQRFDYIPGKI